MPYHLLTSRQEDRERKDHCLQFVFYFCWVLIGYLCICVFLDKLAIFNEKSFIYSKYEGLSRYKKDEFSYLDDTTSNSKSKSKTSQYSLLGFGCLERYLSVASLYCM